MTPDGPIVTDEPGPDPRYPVALLPVRLETRFAGPLLKVRIFPDEIFADTHETGLTADERRDGNAYVAAMNAGTDAEAEAWRALVARYAAPRAAWIALSAAKGSSESRAESWSRAAQATLPDHWLVRAYQDANIYTKTSAPVRTPLALTLSPNATDRANVSDDLKIDAALKWTIDFAEAEAAGMAVTIDLRSPDRLDASHPPAPGAGADLVIVVGLNSSLTAADGAAHLHALFDAHHYARGLAFVATGTPTNNGPGAPAGFPTADPGGSISFAVERAAPLVAEESSAGCNGLLFARALGLPLAEGEHVAAVEHLAGSNQDGDIAAAAMNDALWPATLGYFMEQMMAPQFDTAIIAQARQFFVDHLRAGGPLPAFRVGRVPYGLLPAVSLSRFASDDRFAHALRVLRDSYFLPATAGAPRVAADSADPDGDLLKVLAVDASCRRLRMRTLLGPHFTFNVASWLGAPALSELEGLQATQVASAQALLAALGLGGQPRIAGLDASSADELIGAPLVTSAPLSEDHGLDGADGNGLNYIRWLVTNATANVDGIKDDALPGRARPLLYRFLRHGLLVEMDRLAFEKLVAANVVVAADRAESELVAMTVSPQAPLTTYERIRHGTTIPGFFGSLAPYLARLSTLAAMPTAELERRFGETLDACSHRLDAWITSLATARLWTMRASAPTGCHLGGFGWVENVRPAAPRPQLGGYIHAPSAAHASAAAVLRNGYLSRGGHGTPYAVDLSSARVRDALMLLDAVRQGEPLAALLGYRFERDLHERKIEKLIAPLRGRFPLVAGKTPEGVGPTELVAAGNVVDGLALSVAWSDKTSSFSAANDLPALTADETTRFHAALDALDGAVDGLADLLTAESVFQAVRGNPMAAAASLDAMGQGTMPPDPQVARSPTDGASFTQRVAVALDGGTAPATGAWGSLTPRAATEPFLDAWAGKLLGDPAQIGCIVRLADGSTRYVTLATLKLRPLDVVALSRTPPAESSDGELDRRVLDVAAPDAQTQHGAQIQYDVTDRARSFAEVLELARALGELLAVARPLGPVDLVTPSDASSVPITQEMVEQAVGRAGDALLQLLATLDTLGAALGPVAAKVAAATEPAPGELSALRAALNSAAAFGVVGAYPPKGVAASDLAALAASMQKELSSRQANAPALDATDPSALLSRAVAAVKSVFGRDFLFLPQFTIASPTLLGAELAVSPSLLGDSELPRQVLQQMGRVSAGIGRWRTLWLYAQALGAPAPSLQVAQLPAVPKWAGSRGATVAPGTLSLILHRPDNVPPEGCWVGFVVDEWNETIPSATQSTAISFRQDTAAAEAPQAVLVAVTPSPSVTWDTETLFDTARETLSLAKIRAVDGALLDGLRPFLPAICLAGNTANETVSTHFLSAVVAEPTTVKI